jgi:hypothetical protein
MRAGIRSAHWNDAKGNPEGGTTFGNGFAIGWQHVAGLAGDNYIPTSTTTILRHERRPNGAFVEDVIEAAADRIRYYQSGRFTSAYNAKALEYLKLVHGSRLHNRPP